ncbi:endonuclease/exonuclease/phosphatase family protein [Streptomyces sp. NPDC055078]
MNTPGCDDVCLMFFNLEHDGGPESDPGVLPERWRRAHEEIITPRRPDFLGRAELTYSQTRPGATRREKDAADRRFRAAQKLLGMRGFRAPLGEGRNPTGSFVNETVFTVRTHYAHLGRGWRTPPTNIVLTLPEIPSVPIMTLVVHSAYNSPGTRRIEADEMSVFADRLKIHYPGAPAQAAWIFGDFNEYPVPAGEQTAAIDWASPEVTDRAHRRHRALRQSDGTWRSCTYTDELMLDAGMQDPARWAAIRRQQPSALAATAGHAAPGQGGPRRIDRLYMDPWTVQAVQTVTVIDTSGISDHHAIEVTLSRRKLIEALQRKITPLAPWELVTDPRPAQQPATDHSPTPPCTA